MKKNIKKNIQRKAEIRNELEHISNKSLVIFTFALICGIILLFLYTAFKGVGSYIPKLQAFITGVSILAFIVFLGLIISSCMIKNKKGKSYLTQSLKNWSIVSLAVSICSFFIYPVDITTGFFGIIGLNNKGGVIAMKLTKFMGPTAILTIIIGLVVYVIGMFIYYHIKSKKIKNSK